MKTIEYKVIVEANGYKAWYLNGKRHREDGPAVECVNGDKAWYLNGKFHREDGPAIEFADCTKEWWLNGNRHREDGPAIEYANGTKEWYLNGEEVTEADVMQTIEIDGKKFTLAQIKAALEKA